MGNESSSTDMASDTGAIKNETITEASSQTLTSTDIAEVEPVTESREAPAPAEDSMEVPAEEKMEPCSDKVQYPLMETFDSAEIVKPPIMEKDFVDESKQNLEEKKEIQEIWGADLYDPTAPCPCCEPTDLCCMATFCPYVVFGNNAAML